jgi:hypothetical protein
MSAALPQAQKEELRFAVRECLVAAATVALSAEMVARRLERRRLVDFLFDTRDVVDALTLLVGLGHATETPAALGATKYYQATAAGVLAHERGQ